MIRLVILLLFFIFSVFSKTVVVTGGAGFLGSHLCRKLLNENNKVICVDNLYTCSKNNIFDLLENENFFFINHDIINPLNLHENIHEIYNFACPASPPHYQKDPIQTFKTSIFGALNMLELAKKNNAKIMLASTSEVYGDPLITPQDENYFGNVNCTGIRSCYDEGKRGAEALFFDYHRMYNTKIKVIRIFNTYGPLMDKNDGRVVSNFINQALENKPITIYGSGNQTRSFCYVDDLIEGIIACMNTDDSFIGPVNLGNPNEFTMLQLADVVIQLTNSNSKIVFLDLPKDDPKIRRPDISLAYKTFNFYPKIELEEGLKKTIEYFKNL